jgi:hypothetical protein
LNDLKIFQKLQELGAGEFAHLNGTLIGHLQGTHDLLRRWGADDNLCKAGLYHAVYSTDGFSGQLIAPDQRERVKELIGAPAELIVYAYCACDRRYFWPQIGVETPPDFRDRFSGEEYVVGQDFLENFCELTVANELEIARANAEFVKNWGPVFRVLFARMRPYLSDLACQSFVEILGREAT